MVALILSGLTAIPLKTELDLLSNLIDVLAPTNVIETWFALVWEGVTVSTQNYPFLSYGTDWLGFSHVIISLFFIGVLKDPVRNIWITQVGIYACLLILPTAFIAGHFRGIPFFWQLIDCSFGALGLIPLMIIHQHTKKLQRPQNLKSIQTQ